MAAFLPKILNGSAGAGYVIQLTTPRKFVQLWATDGGEFLIQPSGDKNATAPSSDPTPAAGQQADYAKAIDGGPVVNFGVAEMAYHSGGYRFETTTIRVWCKTSGLLTAVAQ